MLPPLPLGRPDTQVSSERVTIVQSTGSKISIRQEVTAMDDGLLFLNLKFVEAKKSDSESTC